MSRGCEEVGEISIIRKGDKVKMQALNLLT